MKGLKACLLSVLCLSLSLSLAAQVVTTYNINKYGGLPSDMVYSACIDRLGYLWLCTNNGVARYNGYELKTYNVTDGLPSNDVWGLYPDKKNRLWLRTISNRLGYIAGDRYRNVYLQNIGQTLYPRHISEYAQGIFFLTGTGNSRTLYPNVLCLEKNDTLTFSPYYFHNANETHTNLIADLVDSTVFRYRLDGQGRPVPAGRCTWVPEPGVPILLLRDQYIAYRSGDPCIEALNITTCALKKLCFHDEKGHPDPVHFVDHCKGFIYVIAQRSVYKLDSAMRILHRFPMHLLAGDAARLSGERVSNFFEDSFWGRCITTRDQGLYIHYGTEEELSPLGNIDLSGYACIGNVGDSISYWWNDRSGLLAGISANSCRTRAYKLPSAMRKLVPFDKARSLLLLEKSICWFHHRTQTITPFSTGKGQDDLAHTKDIALADSSSLYTSNWNLYRVRPDRDTPSATLIGKNRYYHLEYDSLRRICWAYNSNELLIHPDAGTDIFLHDTLLKKCGINSIEKIITHRSSGNIFLKDYDILYQVDFRRKTMTRLFSNYNLREALFYVHNDRIILAGSFGILFSRINGPSDFSAPVVCPNIKHCQYYKVEDVGTLRCQLVLKTDKKSYLLHMPDDSAFRRRNNDQVPYRIILQYGDSLYALGTPQKVDVAPGLHTLQLDLINPRGNGKVSYQYTFPGIDTGWHEVSGNVLQLPPLKVGRRYTLSIMAGDNVWKSDPVSVDLYLVPLWWQTRSWQVVFWVCGVLLVLATLLAVALLTRHFVARSNDRKQRLATLELKAIHAQINPHFIFNTLNAALYFIKKKKLDDAVNHVTRFSHLLRAYLESSRNRFIRLADEISNLRNYAELQQTRFSHRFSYEIITDNRLPVYSITIPSLLLQPIVENAINHGLMPKGQGGRLTISFSSGPGQHGITCVVDDNGVGRHHSRRAGKNEVLKKESYGNLLIRELIDILNRQEQMGIEIIYLDKELPLTGTRVTILIKNPRYES